MADTGGEPYENRIGQMINRTTELDGRIVRPSAGEHSVHPIVPSFPL